MNLLCLLIPVDPFSSYSLDPYPVLHFLSSFSITTFFFFKFFPRSFSPILEELQILLKQVGAERSYFEPRPQSPASNSILGRFRFLQKLQTVRCTSLQCSCLSVKVMVHW